MNIAFVTDSIRRDISGVGRFSQNIFCELLKSGENLIAVDWRKPYISAAVPLNTKSQSIIVKNPWPCFKTLLWHIYLLKQLEKQSSNFDLLVNPTQYINLAGTLVKPYVYIVHDLSFLTFPECHKHGKSHFFRLFFEYSIRKADCVVCVSEYTKTELLNRFNLGNKRIEVVYEAAEDCFRPIDDFRRLETTKNKYTLPDNFLLYVGTVEPRKNLQNIINTYEKFRDKIPYPFYIAGKLGWRSQSLIHSYQSAGLENQIKFLGYVPDEDLPALYNLATAFVYISKNEGFGLPPLEAMQCGTPVIASNEGSLPEIIGNAGLLTSTNKPEIIGQDIIRVCQDVVLRNQLRVKGFKRAKSFDWKLSAAKLSKIFLELIEKGQDGSKYGIKT